VNGASRADITEALAHAVNKLSEDIIIFKNNNNNNDDDDDDDDILSPFHPSSFGATFQLIPGLSWW
jgi:hypothetical protein